jgi:superfamily II DNA or RNA helicase
VKDQLKNFLEWLKEETPSGVWSRGVVLSKSNAFELVAKTTDEIKITLQTPERLLAFSITLWPVDEDAFCDCGAKTLPCAHIVGAALACERGIKASRQPWVEYDLSFPFKLTRWICDATSRTLLETPLIDLVAGIQSGRISKPLPRTLPQDLRVDGLMQKKATPEEWMALLKELKVFKNGKPVEWVRAEPPRVLIQNQSLPPKVALHVQVLWTPPQGFLQCDDFWMCEKEANTVLMPDAGMPAVSFSRTGPEVEFFLTETLPELSARDAVIEWLPPGPVPLMMDLEPELEFKAEALSNGEIAVTPRIVYGHPKIAEVSHPKLEFLEVGRIPKRKPVAEQILLRKLRSEYHLGADAPAKFPAQDAQSLLKRIAGDGHTLWLNEPTRNLLKPQTYIPAFRIDGGRIKFHFANRKNQDVSIPIEQLERHSSSGSFLVDSLGEPGILPDTLDPALLRTLLHLCKKQEQRGLNRAELRLAKIAIEPRAVAASPLTTNGSDNGIFPVLARLRTYQETGIAFLASHKREGTGCLLADDMGLGKTLQTIAVLEKGSLIVAPSSLVSNWADEIRRFRPELNVEIFLGTGRALKTEGSITLTTYGTLRASVEDLSAVDWSMIVLDEAHQIRNDQTQVHQACRALSASFRVALTGTPMQNSIRDLFGLFSFLNPDLFESAQDLAERVQDSAPFMLRRTKAEVLKELPPKTKITHAIELSTEERQNYQATFWAAGQEFQERFADHDVTPLQVFELLLRARQACCGASKLSALLELVQELTAEGHALLVYSQWTKTLDTIEAQLDAHGISSERLDGSTRDRATVVRDFQKNQTVQVFLLSLHAGGVGLNLTRADHVIFFDPWWNPFVEEQAEDRAYRIGQEKPVFIHRLICKDTIEEGVIHLQAAKQEGFRGLFS